MRKIGAALETAFHEQEMRIERTINVYRSILYLTSAGLDLLMFYQQGVLIEGLLVVAFLLPVAVGYVYLIHHLASDDVYRPWLKYVTSTLDYLIVAGIVVEYKSIGLLTGTLALETWGAILIALIVVYNFLGALRYSMSAVIYNGMLALIGAIGSGLLVAGSPIVALVGAVIVSIGTLISYKLSLSLKQMFVRLRRREALARFLAPEVAERVLRGDIALTPGGEACRVTILFSDIRGFTTIAEDMAPISLLEWLNSYLSRMTDLVFDYGGTLDKFIGDAVLAIFGAPVSRGDDAQRALSTARQMLAAVEDLNETLEEQGRPPLRIGIALHTGTVIAGNIGSERRMEYTVIGDTVNLASRIEALNKEYGTSLIMTEETYRLVEGTSDSTLIAETTVRGRKQPVKLYGVKCDRGD